MLKRTLHLCNPSSMLYPVYRTVVQSQALSLLCSAVWGRLVSSSSAITIFSLWRLQRMSILLLPTSGSTSELKLFNRILIMVSMRLVFDQLCRRRYRKFICKADKWHCTSASQTFIAPPKIVRNILLPWVCTFKYNYVLKLRIVFSVGMRLCLL